MNVNVCLAMMIVKVCGAWALLYLDRPGALVLIASTAVWAGLWYYFLSEEVCEKYGTRVVDDTYFVE